MRVEPFVFLFLVNIVTTPVLCQDVAKAILAEYGGAASLGQVQRFEITGHMGGASLREAFTLKVSGDNSRFETAHFRAIRNGGFAQSGAADKGISKARRSAVGLDQTLIFPVELVVRLADPSFEYAGVSDDVYLFKGTLPRGGFIGYTPPPITVEMTFDIKTLLLRSVVYHCVDDARLNLAMTYEDYGEVDGIPVSTTVTRWSGDKPMYVVRVETVDLNPGFSDEEVQLVGKGGR